MSEVTIEKAPRGYLMRAQCIIPRNLDEVFAFFSDAVNYGVPGGALIHALLLRRDIQSIFRFRQQALKEIFPIQRA